MEGPCLDYASRYLMLFDGASCQVEREMPTQLLSNHQLNWMQLDTGLEMGKLVHTKQ